MDKINKLNKIKEDMLQYNISIDRAIEAITEVVEVLDDYNLNNIITECIITYEQAEEMLKNVEGLQRVQYFLHNIDFWDTDYFFIDGYANLRDVTSRDIDIIIDEVIEYLEKNEV